MKLKIAKYLLQIILYKKDTRSDNLFEYGIRCLKCRYEGRKSERNIKERKGCPACAKIITSDLNSIASIHPEIIPLLLNKEDAHRYSVNTNRKINVKCHDCQNVIAVSVSKLIERGRRCPYCGGGVSRPEKFTCEYLRQAEEQTGIKFERQVSFDWAPNNLKSGIFVE